MSTPVNKVRGVGPKTVAYLQSMNINTAEELIHFGVNQLALAPGFSPGRAATVIAEAKSLADGDAPLQPAAELPDVGEQELSKPAKKDNKKNKKKDKKKDKKRKDAKKNKKDKKKNKKDKKKNKKQKK